MVASPGGADKGVEAGEGEFAATSGVITYVGSSSVASVGDVPVRNEAGPNQSLQERVLWFFTSPNALCALQDGCSTGITVSIRLPALLYINVGSGLQLIWVWMPGRSRFVAFRLAISPIAEQEARKGRVETTRIECFIFVPQNARQFLPDESTTFSAQERLLSPKIAENRPLT